MNCNNCNTCNDTIFHCVLDGKMGLCCLYFNIKTICQIILGIVSCLVGQLIAITGNGVLGPIIAFSQFVPPVI